MIFTLIIVGPLFIISAVVLCLIIYLPKKEPPAISYQLADPPGPVETDYLDIIGDIENCSAPDCLKNVHTRILIFQSCYPDSPVLIEKIWALFSQKYRKINMLT